MANIKEIQSRIKSIKDTKQITGAMYMISSSKLQKAKKNLEETEAYFNLLRETIGNVLENIPDVKSKYLEDDENRYEKKAYLVITSDKGLAGAYNLNIIKKVLKELEENPDASLFVMGEVGKHYFYDNKNFDKDFNFAIANPSVNRGRRICGYLLNLFDENKFDELYIIYTKMVNAMTSETVCEKLIPMDRKFYGRFVKNSEKYNSLDFYPSAEEVINKIAPGSISGYIFSAMTEAFCSEQNERMTAMKTANDSANDMIKELSVAYNRSRQAAITQELNEVIGGSRVLKAKKAKKEAELFNE